MKSVLQNKFNNLKSNNEYIILVLVLLLGTFLRVYGIWGRSPFYTDEADFVWPSMHLIESHLNPYSAGANFGHPAHLLMYVLFLSFGIYFVTGRVLGYFSAPHSFYMAFLKQPMSFYLIGRAESVMLGILTIIIIYLIAKKSFNREIALLSALFLAVSPLHSGYSQLIRADILMTFLVTLSFLFSIYVFEKRELKYYLLSGICIGLGIATKYPAAVAIIPFVLAHFLPKEENESCIKRLFDKRLIMGLGCILIAFIVSAPFVLLDIRKTTKLFMYEAGANDTSGIIATPFQKYWWFVTYAMNQGHGTIVQILSGIGISYLIIRRNRRDILLLSFPIAFIICIGLLRIRFTYGLLPITHWVLPILPLTSVFGAVGLVKISGEGENLSWMKLNLFIPLVAVVSVAAPVYHIIYNDWLNLQKHPRAIANEWVEQNIPQGSIIAVEEYTPPVSTTKYRVLIAPKIQMLKQIPSNVEANSETNLHGRTWRFWLGNVHEFSVLNDNHVEYVVISLRHYNRFKKNPGKYPKEIEFYETLFREGELIYQINPDKRLDDPIRVYRLKFSH